MLLGLGGWEGGWVGGGQGSRAGPAWVPPVSPGLGGWGRGWVGGPRVLGRAGLVFNTLKNHDSDKDFNIILLRNMTVIRMLI